MSLTYRRDVRSEKEFEQDISNRTAKQRFLIDLYSKELKFRAIQHSISDYGVDNSGKLIKGSVGCNADYLVTFDKKTYKVELQNCGIDKYVTFKVANLKKYVEDEVNILLFYNTGFIDKDPTQINYESTRFAWIATEKIQDMLFLERYKEDKFGNKLCVRIDKKDFHKYFDAKRLLSNNIGV